MALCLEADDFICKNSLLINVLLHNYNKSLAYIKNDFLINLSLISLLFYQCFYCLFIVVYLKITKLIFFVIAAHLFNFVIKFSLNI